MKDVKFRGKDEDDKKWYVGYYVGNDGIVCLDDMQYDGGRINDCPCHCCLPGTIGQHTGLKDIDGRDIYEMDILSLTRDGSVFSFVTRDEDDVNFELYFPPRTGHTATLPLTSLNVKTLELKVIGNAHDNPEYID